MWWWQVCCGEAHHDGSYAGIDIVTAREVLEHLVARRRT
jgi:hypothetical protein